MSAILANTPFHLSVYSLSTEGCVMARDIATSSLLLFQYKYAEEARALRSFDETLRLAIARGYDRDYRLVDTTSGRVLRSARVRNKFLVEDKYG